MADGIKLEIEGIDETIKALNKLPLEIERKVLDKAVRKGLKPTLQLAKAYCPVDTGTLRDSLIMKTKKMNRAVVGIVGPDSNAEGQDSEGNLRRPVKYAHLVEFGHSIFNHPLEEFVKTNDSSPKLEVPAKPFLRPAWENTKGIARTLLVDEIIAGVTREAAKLGFNA